MEKPLTPYEDVNGVLHLFHKPIEAILGAQFRGMYLYGSLALGDFDPQSSDVDFVVVTDSEITDNSFADLSEMHAKFEESGSPWSGKLEVVYISQDALHYSDPANTKFPQIEKGTPLLKEHLEPGWAMQRHVLREYGIVIAGPAPQTLMKPVDPNDMRRAIAEITGTWLEQAQDDPSWLHWLGQRDAQSFVVLTLCRSLYTLETGTVASKPAASWAQQTLGKQWSELVKRALASQHDESQTAQIDIAETLTLLQYVVEHSHR